VQTSPVETAPVQTPPTAAARKTPPVQTPPRETPGEAGSAPLDQALSPEELARRNLREAQRLHRRGRSAAALALVDQVLSATPRDVKALVLKADILLAMRQPRVALVPAQSAVGLAPGHAMAWFTKGMIHYELKQYADAKSALGRYLELRPNAQNAEEIRIVLESL
jgi:tetratricopeptide (TPR) repeat protein